MKRRPNPVALALSAAFSALVAAGVASAQDEGQSSGADRGGDAANRGAGSEAAASGNGVIQKGGSGSGASATKGANVAGAGGQGGRIGALDLNVSVVRPDNTALRRRANRQALIAVPQGASAAVHANTNFELPAGGSARNAIGAAAPGGPALHPNGAGLAIHGSGAAIKPGGLGASGASNNQVVHLPGQGNGGGPYRYEGINGTNVGHVAVGPGHIGGPAKDRAGINGSALRPRY